MDAGAVARAVDMAIQYSDMSLLDTLYSWCMQSSPFLVSQINKRLIPIYKRNFVFGRNGRENSRLTEKYIRNSWWFKRFIRYILLSQFYGCKMVAINPEKRKVVDFPPAQHRHLQRSPAFPDLRILSGHQRRGLR